MLLVTGSRVENTGMTWNAERSLAADWGGTPTVIEPVTGTITVHDLAKAGGVSARVLDGSGHPMGEPMFARPTNAGWVITVGGIVTPGYELTVRR
jgi:hypothetical protein